MYAWFLFNFLIFYDFATLDLMIVMPTNGPCTLLSHIEAQTAGIRSRQVAIFRPLWDTIGSAPQMEKVLTRLNVETYANFSKYLSLNQHPCHWDHWDLFCFFCWAARIFFGPAWLFANRVPWREVDIRYPLALPPWARWQQWELLSATSSLPWKGRASGSSRKGSAWIQRKSTRYRRGSLIPWSKHFRFTAIEPIPGAVEGGSLRGHHPQNLDDQYCHVVCCGSPCA